MLGPLRFVLAGYRPVRTLAVGALLSSLGVFVLPGVFVAGFYGRVLARSAVDGARRSETETVTDPSAPLQRTDENAADRGLPAFEAWRSLGFHGVKTWTVACLYLAAVGTVALGIGVAALAAGAAVGGGAGATVGALAVALFALTAVGVLSLPVWFFVPVALTRLALTGRVGAALELRTVLRTAVRRAYLARWLAGMVVIAVGWTGYVAVSIGSGLVTGALALGPFAVVVPVAGHVLGAGVNFACQVVAFALFGRGYAAAVRGSDHDPLLDEVTAAVATPTEGWGHDGRLPPWGELRERAAADEAGTPVESHTEPDRATERSATLD